MINYGIRFTTTAQKEFNKLPAQLKLRIGKALTKLQNNPRQGSVRSMIGTASWRLRVGDYRIIYDIQDDKLIILVIRVRHRKEAYRK